jgi:hypothetical protein
MRYIDMNERELIESLHRNEARRVRALRQRTTARSTGTAVEIYDTTHPENVFDPDGGRWVTICQHGSLVNHPTLATARSFASAPEVWCEACHERTQPKGAA